MSATFLQRVNGQICGVEDVAFEDLCQEYRRLFVCLSVEKMFQKFMNVFLWNFETMLKMGQGRSDLILKMFLIPEGL